LVALDGKSRCFSLINFLLNLSSSGDRNVGCRKNKLQIQWNGIQFFVLLSSTAIAATITAFAA
jgi:hypothetical protein